MESYACFAVVVEEEKIKEMEMESFESFVKILEDHNVSFNEFAYAYVAEDVIDEDRLTEDTERKIFEAFDYFQQEFDSKTGLFLEVGFHDSDNHGSSSDEVNGGFYHLAFDDVYQVKESLIPLKANNSFELKRFVSFG